MNHGLTKAITVMALVTLVATPAHARRFWGEELQATYADPRGGAPITEWCYYVGWVKTSCYCRNGKGQKFDCGSVRDTGGSIGRGSKADNKAMKASDRKVEPQGTPRPMGF